MCSTRRQLKINSAFLAAAILLSFSGCANLISRQPAPSHSLLSRTKLLTPNNDLKLLPSWANRVPAPDTSVYFVGESNGSADKEEALSKAWASALVRIGMSEFPELSQVATSHVETLNGNQSSRGLVLHLEQVNWAGVTEVKEQGSPVLFWDENEGGYRAFRLLKWDRGQMALAHRSITKKKNHSLPVPPEMMVREEQQIVEAVAEIQLINAKNQWKEKLYNKVFSELKCGATIADVIGVLGAPDRFNPYNSVVLEKEYYWGNYRVESQRADPRISAVILQQNGKEKRKSCPVSAG